MTKATIDHSFAVCAYGESPYLRECLDSVFNQEQKGSEVFLATSTPSAWLDSIAEEYGISVYVNHGEHGIGQDWNFAYACAQGNYVTIVHQDDMYLPGYAAEALCVLDRHADSLIFFSDYGELRAGKRVDTSANLRIKRMLLHPLRNEKHGKVARFKRRALAFGSAICCPAVTFNRTTCPNPPFMTRMRCSLDWDTWEHLARLDGGFYYSDRILMYHRIHGGSATTELIANNTRATEDAEMFARFWPTPIARILARAYSTSEKSNDLGIEEAG